MRNLIDRILRPRTLTDHLLHDAGHALTAAGVWLAVLLLGGPGLVGVALGTIGVALVQESIDYFKFDKTISRDSVHDVATYQPLWIFYLLHIGQPVLALVTAGLIASSVVVFYWDKIKKRKGLR
jgi:hypothetical protein